MDLPVVGGRLPRRFLALALLVATACSVSGGGTVVGGAAGTPAPGGELVGEGAEVFVAPEAGVSLVPVTSRPIFVFGQAVPVSYVQHASYALVEVVPFHDRLKARPLPSPTGTAALNLIEDAGKKDKWGEVMTPAQRLIFNRFASDTSLGDWLVVVNDVNVLVGPDPVPLTAYRWHRSAVEDYATCGIPAPGVGVPWEKIDSCTDAFYIAAETVLVALVGTGSTDGSGSVGR